MAWQDDWQSVQDFQNSKEFNPTDKTVYVQITQKGDYINYIFGYQNTKIIQAYNDYNKRIGRTRSIVKPVEALANFSNSNPAPRTSTGWFIPSVKELYMLCNNDHDQINKHSYNIEETKRIIDKYLLAIGGDLLESTDCWSSSEYSSANAFFIKFNGGSKVAGGKPSTTTVRAVCAF